MSGFASDGPVNLLEYAERKGADKVLEKTFAIDVLEAAIEAVLS